MLLRLAARRHWRARRRSRPAALFTAATAWSRSALRLLQRLPAGVFLAGQRLLALEFGLHAHLRGLRRDELRLGLLDRRLLRGDLPAEARDGGAAACRPCRARIDGQPIVAVIDAGDHVAGVDLGVVVDGELGDIAGDLGASVVLLART